jgi:hypothetical protein
MIAQALTRTRSELEALDRRREELVEQIERAEAILGSSGSQPRRNEAGPMTLHAALVRILEDNGNEWVTARELADEVNRRALYRKRDGSAVEVNQVHARTSNYARLFEKDGPRIRLQKGATVMTTHAPDIAMFKDDDQGFLDWQDDNPNGYFINTERKPNPKYLVLHKAGCPHFKGSESLRWTKDYVKVCSGDRPALTEWATEAVGGEVTLCGTCFA